MKIIMLCLMVLPSVCLAQLQSIKLSPIICFEAPVSKYYNQTPSDKNLKKDFPLDFAMPNVGIAIEVAFRNRMFLQASVWEAEVGCNFKNMLKNGVCSKLYKEGFTGINHTLLMLELGKYSQLKSGKVFKKTISYNLRYAVGLGYGKLETVGINNTGGSFNLGYSTCYNGDNIFLYEQYSKYLNKNVLLVSPRIGMSFVTKTNRPVINVDIYARFGLNKNFQVDWKYRREVSGVKTDYSVSAITRGTSYGIQFSYPISIYKRTN